MLIYLILKLDPHPAYFVNTTDIPYIRPRIFGTYQWISPKIAYKALPQIAFYFVA